MGSSSQESTQQFCFRLSYSRKRKARVLVIVFEEARLARISKELSEHLLDFMFLVLILDIPRSKVKEPCVRKPRRPHFLEPCIAAGLFGTLAWQYTGELWLCDIGYPPEALDDSDLEGDGLFETNELVRLR